MESPPRVIDLTLPLDSNLEIYSDDKYSDPDFNIETWCTVESQGYLVSTLRLGTQTGTHIDAPAHFYYGGATLESLAVEKLIGSYFQIKLDEIDSKNTLDEIIQNYKNQQILFLTSSKHSSSLTRPQLETLLSLEISVWAIVGSVTIEDEASLSFHQHLAEYGVFLIEDLNFEACQSVPPDGTMVALPLNLQGTSGAPCRVVIITNQPPE